MHVTYSDQINQMSSALVLVSLFVISHAKTLPSDFMLLGLTPNTPLIKGLTCPSYRPFFGDNTDYLCGKIPQLHQILQQSNIQAHEQCQFHFRDHPWGCQLSSKIAPLRRFLRQASKEASLYNTLASATLTLNLINACIKGQINDTDCLCSSHGQPCQTDFQGVFDLARLITDGLNMSNDFQHKLLFRLNQANKELGRKVVKSLLRKECRCHGVSGSCELQICRLRPAKLFDISSEIYLNAYQNARYVETWSHVEARETTQLIYARKSINYCRSNSFIDYYGTQQGRECFSNAGCEQACCQRGYQVLTETKRVDHCRCFFSWNIVNVQCQPCDRKATRMVCL